MDENVRDAICDLLRNYDVLHIRASRAEQSTRGQVDHSSQDALQSGVQVGDGGQALQQDDLEGARVEGQRASDLDTLE